MGGVVSAGADNDELIDNLLEADYIKTAAIERVFRAVDRGHYFTVEYKERAYRDIAWKRGNLHISAPCIYSKVMETLKLAPGMSFLNLGSGTGYLSTMAGLILGPYGINHGIEIHEDVFNYATKKLEEFISSASAMDEYEFCEPKFVCGNCLHLGSGARQYDRVYCSAACPENHESYMKNLIKVGGILVIPVNDQLLQICRTSDTNWESKSILPVTFATLISGKSADVSDPLKMPDADPLPLQDICRFVVRSILRRNIDIEHPELKKPPRVPRKKVKKRTTQLVMPIFDNNSSSDEEEDFFSVQTGRSIIGWSQILRRPDRDTSMDEDPPLNAESAGSFEIFDEMSEPNFEKLQNMLAMSETSGSDSDGGRQRAAVKQEKIDSGIVEDFEAASDSEDRDKRPFLQVPDSDTDTESCEEGPREKPDEKSPQSASSPSPPAPDALTYTSCMKEKIRLLPLPMTLKYFLNLNREL